MSIKLNIFTIVATDPTNGSVVPIGLALSQESADMNALGLINAIPFQPELADSIRVVPAVLIFDESSFDG